MGPIGRIRTVIPAVEDPALPCPSITTQSGGEAPVGRSGHPLIAVDARLRDRAEHYAVAESPGRMEVQNDPRRRRYNGLVPN